MGRARPLSGVVRFLGTSSSEAPSRTRPRGLEELWVHPLLPSRWWSFLSSTSPSLDDGSPALLVFSALLSVLHSSASSADCAMSRHGRHHVMSWTCMPQTGGCLHELHAAGGPMFVVFPVNTRGTQRLGAGGSTGRGRSCGLSGRRLVLARKWHAGCSEHVCQPLVGGDDVVTLESRI